MALFCIDPLDTHLAVENEIPEELLGIINIGVEEFVQWREGAKNARRILRYSQRNRRVGTE